MKKIKAFISSLISALRTPTCRYFNYHADQDEETRKQIIKMMQI